VRASGTSPRAVEAYVAELERPERLTIGLVGPGGPEALEAIEPTLQPIRDAGITVERVWDYRADSYEQARAARADILRLSRSDAATLFGRIDPYGELRDGPVALALALDASLTVNGVDDPERLPVLRDAGVHFVTGSVAGDTARRPFASELLAAA
jgi:sugar/nucleoside kinase (ribokinase family)